MQRPPAMIAPAWLQNATQPIGIDDTLAYLVQAPSTPDSLGREAQIGGPDVLPTARCSTGWPSHWTSARGRGSRPADHTAAVVALDRLVTPVDASVARPLVEGLVVSTVVDDPSGATLFDVEPIGFDEALRRAIAEEASAAAA